MGLGLKVHDDHGLGLEHDLGLGVAQAISLVGITSLWSHKLSYYAKEKHEYKLCGLRQGEKALRTFSTLTTKSV